MRQTLANHGGRTLSSDRAPSEGTVAGIGTGWTVKVQYGIMAVMGAALAEFFAVTILGFGAREEGAEKAFFEGMESLVGSPARGTFVDRAGGVELEN